MSTQQIPSVRTVSTYVINGVKDKCTNCYHYGYPCMNCNNYMPDADSTLMDYQEFRNLSAGSECAINASSDGRYPEDYQVYLKEYSPEEN